MRTQSRDTSPEAERVLIDLIRKASVAKRFGLVRSMTKFAAALNLKNIQEQLPNASNEVIAERFVANHHTLALANELHIALQNRTTQLTTDLFPALTALSDIFEHLSIPYYMQGTIVASLYGMQRTAFDAEFVADLHTKHIDVIQKQLEAYFATDIQAMRDAVYSRTYFEIVHIESLIKIKIRFAQRSHFERDIYSRIQYHILSETGRAICIASPEDSILTQLMEYQIAGAVADDQWNEILGVLKVQGTSLDTTYLGQWANRLKIADLLKKGYVDAGLEKEIHSISHIYDIGPQS